MSKEVKLFDKNVINKTELDIMIGEYLDDYLTPDFSDLNNNNDILDGKNYYAFKTIRDRINKHRIDLQEDLNRLDYLEYLFNKNLFPIYYQGFVCKLIESNDKLLYRIMNDECKCLRGTEEIPHWNAINVNLDTYCYKILSKTHVCDNCQYYLELIKKTRSKY